MMCNNLDVDLVNRNAYIKLGEILSICFLDIERKQNFGEINSHYSGTNVQIMTCVNPTLDRVNINAYITFGEILSICSQDNQLK